LPAHLRKVGVLALQNYEVDRLVDAACRIYERGDPDNVRSLLRQIVAKAHAEAKKERSQLLRQMSAAKRFEDELRPRIEEFEKALEPARKIVACGEWERLQLALLQAPGVLRDMALPQEGIAANALLEVFANLRIASRTGDARVATPRGRPAEIYPKAVIETLAREWVRTFPCSPLKSINTFPKSPKSPQSATGIFAAFAKAAWHDLAFEPDELTVDRLNGAIATVGGNSPKTA
jgi:hypothetical protein